MNLCTVKWAQCDENPIQRTARTAHLSVLMTVHNFSTQYNTEQFTSDNLPSYLQTNIIAQMLSIGGKGVLSGRTEIETITANNCCHCGSIL